MEDPTPQGAVAQNGDDCTCSIHADSDSSESTAATADHQGMDASLSKGLLDLVHRLTSCMENLAKAQSDSKKEARTSRRKTTKVLRKIQRALHPTSDSHTQTSQAQPSKTKLIVNLTASRSYGDEAMRNPAPIPSRATPVAETKPGYINLEDSMQWAKLAITELMTDDPDDVDFSPSLNNFVIGLNDMKFSTAFSGIDSPGTALMELGAAARDIMHIEARLGRPIPTPLAMQPCQFHIEWDRLCQEELMIHPHSSCMSCCFGDVSSLWKPKAAKLVENLRSSSGHDIVSMLKPCIMNNVGVKTNCWCGRHHTNCKLQSSTLHVAGSPCTDFSNLGKKQECEGKTNCDTIAWIGSARQLEHHVVILENVVSETLLEMVYSLLDDLYHCDKTIESPEYMGFP